MPTQLFSIWLECLLKVYFGLLIEWEIDESVTDAQYGSREPRE